MQVNGKGITLICEFESCRTQAYRDSVGVWTIGYGHTSMTGSPEVSKGMRITQAKAEEILQTDVDRFARGVSSLIKVQLNDNQFSALVSFAFNVGLNNLRRSSVLKAVNASDFEAVPRRLALWVKAGGKVLPGLIIRRAAEAALFVLPVLTEEPGIAETTAASVSTKPKRASNPTPAIDEKQQIEPIHGLPFHISSTTVAAVLSGAGGILSSAAKHLESHLGKTGSVGLEIAAVAVVLLAAAWIIHRRRERARLEGI